MCHSEVEFNKKLRDFLERSWAGRCSTSTLFMNYGNVHVFLEEKRVKAY